MDTTQQRLSIMNLLTEQTNFRLVIDFIGFDCVFILFIEVGALDFIVFLLLFKSIFRFFHC